MEEHTQPILQVAAKAVIVKDGKVLILREAPTPGATQVGKWGLPGGRLEPGEAFFDGLKREAQEETGLVVEPIRPLYVGEWRPVVQGTPHQIVALFMLCRQVGGEVAVSDEHDDLAWIDPAERSKYLMMPPDGAVIDILVAERS